MNEDLFDEDGNLAPDHFGTRGDFIRDFNYHEREEKIKQYLDEEGAAVTVKKLHEQLFNGRATEERLSILHDTCKKSDDIMEMQAGKVRDRLYVKYYTEEATRQQEISEGGTG
jgi:hypothetical protein